MFSVNTKSQVPVGPPSAPLGPIISPQSITVAILLWAHPSPSLRITRYIITLTNITEGNVSNVYSTVSSETSVEIHHLTQEAEYSFTVAGVDTENRIREESAPSEELTLGDNITNFDSLEHS